MKIEYLDDEENYKAIAQLLTQVEFQALRQAPQNDEQFECLLEDELEKFVKKNTKYATEEFRDMIYRVTDMINFGYRMVQGVFATKASYAREFLPNNRSIVAGVLYNAAILNNNFAEGNPDNTEYFPNKDQFVRTAEVAYELAQQTRKNKIVFDKEHPKWLQ